MYGDVHKIAQNCKRQLILVKDTSTHRRFEKSGFCPLVSLSCQLNHPLEATISRMEVDDGASRDDQHSLE